MGASMLDQMGRLSSFLRLSPLLSCTAARLVSATLLELPGALGDDGDSPESHEVERDFCLAGLAEWAVVVRLLTLFTHVAVPFECLSWTLFGLEVTCDYSKFQKK